MNPIVNQLVNDSFLEYRVRHLIYYSVLEVKGISNSMRHYSFNSANFFCFVNFGKYRKTAS
ncbi:hypothetical protein JOC85_001841 [Bacillus mesophilus]|uniref:DUF3658 domain-containing protein n=1 Tax=Bacillus mesophilus TaxID=1808955 RepID=A0A6M0Q4T0_9BACI|nr:hypothetical protein [Bacillus mesophilus]NEY71396.1 hypothetical protein [Bacillus mesophilus]